MTIGTNMGNAAVINLINRNRYFYYPFFHDQSVLERVMAFRDSLPDITRTIVLLTEPLEQEIGAEEVIRETWTEEDLFDVFKNEAENCADLFYFWGDYPLLDSRLAADMYINHRKYYAGYTFADGYPLGFSPEILRSSEIAHLHELSRGSRREIKRNSIFEVLQKDINAFDIETELSPVDFRMYRISLSCDNRRNSEQLKKLIDAGIGDRQSFLDKIDGSREALRTKPAYYQIQISDSCPQLCFYCPFSAEAAEPEKRKTLDLERYSELLDRIVDFSDDAHIAVSAWGEPSLHGNFTGIVEETIKHPSLKLVIETSGLGWQDGDLEKIASLQEKSGGRISWIVSLDAMDRDLYRKLRGEGYDEAWQCAHRLFELFGTKCWVQAVRMEENEVNLEDFYRYWKKTSGNIIIQKYDWFCGVREQKKITDLSPLNRDPCWHLKRDMFIRLNGDVPLCREDLNNSVLLGNVFTESLEEIWNAGEKIYLDHLEGRYSTMCGKCDEYYTFNF